MLSSSLFFVCLLVVCPFAASGVVPHVRPLDELASEALRYGQRSTLFRQLIADLETSDVIVHVETAWNPPGGFIGLTRLMRAINGYRYVRVTLSATLLIDARTATLGHELQHVRELARSSATTIHEIRALYSSIGHATNGAKDTFETDAAIAAGHRVRIELLFPARTRAGQKR